MKKMHVVAVVTKYNGTYLIAKRAPSMPSHANLWGVIAGLIESKENVKEAALRELREETGLIGEVIMVGEEFVLEEKAHKYFITPVLVKTNSNNVILDGEHTNYEWIYPNELWNYKCVPKTEKDFMVLGIDIGKPSQL